MTNFNGSIELLQVTPALTLLEKNMKILLVEDSALNREVIANMLITLGGQVQTVENGQSALKNLEQNGYDLVLMDCDMPILDGYATTQAIRHLEQTQQRPAVPIIALTAHEMTAEHQQTCQLAGMNDCLTKPVYLKTLQAILDRWVVTNAPINQHTPTQTEIPTLDAHIIKQLQEVMGQEMTLCLLKHFINYAPQQLTLLQQWLNHGDLENLRRQAHKFKGESLQLGAIRVGTLCKQIENLALTGQLDALKICLATLQEELAKASQLIIQENNHEHP